jgi:hypothetical protein
MGKLVVYAQCAGAVLDSESLSLTTSTKFDDMQGQVANAPLKEGA